MIKTSSATAVLGLVLLAALTFGTAMGQDGGGQGQPQGSGDVVMFVFDGNQPVVGAQLKVDGRTVSRTGEDGGILTKIPAGRHDVAVVRDGKTVFQLDLLTAVGEQIRIIAVLQDDGEPHIDISSTGTGPVLATNDGGNKDDGGNKPGLLEGVITSDTGEPVVNARVRVPARGRAVRTDDTGRYRIELPPGSYSIEVSHPEFATQIVKSLRVIPGKSVSANLTLSEAGVQLAEYVVTGTYEEGSVAAEIATQRESAQVVNVIGAEQIARTGDSNAAEALQRVSGLVMQRSPGSGNRYVIIRGQPFRYTLTLFNGLPLPSPDPVLQTVPLNLFPESILANVVVQKSYSANRLANFGGGLIELNTVTTPVEPFFKLKASTGVNDFSTWKDGLTYDGTDKDWIGGIGGQRELPDAVPPAGGDFGSANSQRRGEIGRSFNDLVLLEEYENLPPDLGLEAAGGAPFATDYGTFGVLAEASYNQIYRNIRERDIDFQTGQGGALEPRTDFLENRTNRQVQLTGFLSLTGDWDHHRLTSNTFFIRNTRDRTEIAQGTDQSSQPREERRFLLVYNQREMLLTQLLGKHEFEWFTFNWRAQTARTHRDRPDRRDWAYFRPLGTDRDLIFFAEGDLERDYNKVHDEVNSLGADVTAPLPQFGAVKSELSVGYNYNHQKRSSDTRRFTFTPADTADLGSPFIELIINDDTIESGGPDNVDFVESTLATDSYDGKAQTQGYFINTDTRVGDILRIAAGVRRAEADYDVSNAVDSGGFTKNFILPALSVTGFLPHKMQLRASVGQSVSYPLLVELSQTTFFNPDTGEPFTGNPDLKPTEFTSYDLRWEWYPSALEALSVGLFYKDLTNPIEQQFEPIGGGDAVVTTFFNSPSAKIYGAEIGGRASLGWLGQPLWLDRMYISGNLSLIDSKVDVGEAGIATNDERPLTGQADHVLNAQLGYDGAIHDATLSFNRVGERLFRAGVQGRPDVYQEPVNFLNFTYSIRIPEGLPFIGDVAYLDDGRITFQAVNLLDQEWEFRQGGQLQRRLTFGRTFSAALQLEF